MTEKDAGTEEQQQPTTEEKLTEALSQLETEKTARIKAESSEQGLRGSLKEKDRKLAEQDDISSRLDTVQDMVKIMATEGFKMSEENLEAQPDRRASIDKMFADMQTSSKQKREVDTKQRAQDDFNTKADTIFSKAKEVFKDNEDMLERVETQLMLGKFDRAEALISKEKPKEGKMETDEDRTARLEKEWEIKHGLRDEITGQPKSSSTTFTGEQIANMPDEEYIKLKPEIDKARTEGRIK